jgi:hypothetical protein
MKTQVFSLSLLALVENFDLETLLLNLTVPNLDLFPAF